MSAAPSPPAALLGYLSLTRWLRSRIWGCMFAVNKWSADVGGVEVGTREMKVGG